jgi:hypothetical protein
LAYVGIDLGDNFTGCFGWGNRLNQFEASYPARRSQLPSGRREVAGFV